MDKVGYELRLLELCKDHKLTTDVLKKSFAEKKHRLETDLAALDKERKQIVGELNRVYYQTDEKKHLDMSRDEPFAVDARDTGQEELAIDINSMEKYSIQVEHGSHRHLAHGSSGFFPRGSEKPSNDALSYYEYYANTVAAVCEDMNHAQSLLWGSFLNSMAPHPDTNSKKLLWLDPPKIANERNNRDQVSEEEEDYDPQADLHLRPYVEQTGQKPHHFPARIWKNDQPLMRAVYHLDKIQEFRIAALRKVTPAHWGGVMTMAEKKAEAEHNNQRDFDMMKNANNFQVDDETDNEPMGTRESDRSGGSGSMSPHKKQQLHASELEREKQIRVHTIEHFSTSIVEDALVAGTISHEHRKIMEGGKLDVDGYGRLEYLGKSLEDWERLVYGVPNMNGRMRFTIRAQAVDLKLPYLKDMNNWKHKLNTLKEHKHPDGTLIGSSIGFSGSEQFVGSSATDCFKLNSEDENDMTKSAMAKDTLQQIMKMGEETDHDHANETQGTFSSAITGATGSSADGVGSTASTIKAVQAFERSLPKLKRYCVTAKEDMEKGRILGFLTGTYIRTATYDEEFYSGLDRERRRGHLFEPGVYHFRLHSTETEINSQPLTLLLDPPELNPLGAIDDLALYFEKKFTERMLSGKNKTHAMLDTEGRIRAQKTDAPVVGLEDLAGDPLKILVPDMYYKGKDDVFYEANKVRNKRKKSQAQVALPSAISNTSFANPAGAAVNRMSERRSGNIVIDPKLLAAANTNSSSAEGDDDEEEKGSKQDVKQIELVSNEESSVVSEDSNADPAETSISGLTVMGLLGKNRKRAKDILDFEIKPEDIREAEKNMGAHFDKVAANSPPGSPKTQNKAPGSSPKNKYAIPQAIENGIWLGADDGKNPAGTGPSRDLYKHRASFANVEYVEIPVRGMPFVFVRARESIRKGEELVLARDDPLFWPQYSASLIRMKEMGRLARSFVACADDR